MLIERYNEVKKHVEEACKRVGRDPREVTVIAVSKTKPVEMIEEAMEAGARVFGENKVQELCDKYEQLPKDLHWHLIGHLQRNKVKYVVGRAAMIHSVDSERLAVAISEEAVKKGLVQDILIEVNVAGEENKFGVTCDEAEEFVKKIAVLSGIKIRGFMTSAPFVENPEDNRKYFRELKQLLVDINNKNIDNVYMNVLSMGMTNDYTVAVEEGATHVRVGTAIFGARDYSH